MQTETNMRQVECQDQESVQSQSQK